MDLNKFIDFFGWGELPFFNELKQEPNNHPAELNEAPNQQVSEGRCSDSLFEISIWFSNQNPKFYIGEIDIESIHQLKLRDLNALLG